MDTALFYAACAYAKKQGMRGVLQRASLEKSRESDRSVIICDPDGKVITRIGKDDLSVFPPLPPSEYPRASSIANESIHVSDPTLPTFNKEDHKSMGNSAPTTALSPYEKQKLCKDLKCARIRIKYMALFHLLSPPLASLTYAIKTQYWTPFALATVIGIFTSFFSFGVAIGSAEASDPDSAFLISFVISSLLGLIPASLSFFMFKNRAMLIRHRNNIYEPEQADKILYENLGFFG